MKEILDVALNKNPISGVNNIAFDETGDFLMTDNLGTAIRISLFTNKRADASEIPNPLDRGGWWGNVANEEEGFEIGSKLWLLKQSKLNFRVVNLAIAYSKDALNWLKDKGFVDQIRVSGTLSKTNRSVVLRIVLSKKNTVIADERLEYLLFDTEDVN